MAATSFACCTCTQHIVCRYCYLRSWTMHFRSRRVPGVIHVYGNDPKKGDPANFASILQYQEILGGKVGTDARIAILHQIQTVHPFPKQAILYVIDKVLKIPVEP